MHVPATRTGVVQFGLFEADLDQRLLSKDGHRVKLQDQPFQILKLLLERPGDLVTRDEIRQKLWAADTYVEFNDGLNTAIKKLRTASATPLTILVSLRRFPAVDIGSSLPSTDRQRLLSRCRSRRHNRT
jgi:DNA-binding response OmpR family regulator